jgi:hypothetical protein
MGWRLAVPGVLVPAALILAVTLTAAIHTRLQGIIITIVGIAVFIVAMLFIPRIKREKTVAPAVNLDGNSATT